MTPDSYFELISWLMIVVPTILAVALIQHIRSSTRRAALEAPSRIADPVQTRAAEALIGSLGKGAAGYAQYQFEVAVTADDPDVAERWAGISEAIEHIEHGRQMEMAD